MPSIPHATLIISGGQTGIDQAALIATKAIAFITQLLITEP